MTKTETMHPDLSSVREYAALVATVLGAILACIAFWAKIVAGAKYLGSAIIGWVTLPARIQRDVASIKAQTLPNGGKSLADSINRLERGVEAIREKQLENYQTMAALAANDDVGMWESTIEGDCISINQNILKRVGLSLTEVQGKGWVNFIAPEDRDRVYDEWYKACAQQRDFILKYSYITADGTRIPISAHSYPIRGMDGKIVKYIGLVRFN